MLKNYELLVAFGEETSEAAQKELIKEISATIEKSKGQVDQEEAWGKRALAYPIKKNKNAYYHLVTFSGEESLPKILTDTLRIEEAILRFIVIVRQKPSKVSKKKLKVATVKKLDELVVR
ncbi:MAG TPA: 30S ribosomal protein S6 [Candidatus Nanoarchaeia archaeon]|nr:30S ribosomal protein S6 [uncultured archaeon]